MRLPYYLFNKSVKNFSDVWKDAAHRASYSKITLDPLPFNAEAYVQSTKAKTPPWVSFVKPFSKDQLLTGLLNVSNSFILLIKTSQRIFAITFGHSYTALDDRKFESDFGLTVTLNTVDKNRLKSMQSRNVDTKTVSKQFVASQDSSLTAFDVDFYQELLAKLEGAPNSLNKDVGTRIAGADACYVTGKISLDLLGRKCDSLFKKFKDTSYKANFRFRDHLKVIRDDKLKIELDQAFVTACRAKDTSLMSLALPDISSHDDIDKYEICQGHWSEEFEDLDIDLILDKCVQQFGSLLDPFKIDVNLLDDQKEEFDSVRFSRCVVYQQMYKDAIYVLTLGKWYFVDSTYAAAIDAEIDNIEVITNRAFLPDIFETGKKAEERYNARAAKQPGMILLDQDFVPIMGVDKIEVCDLFSKDRQFIHVKRKTRSATLSHLLAQGSVSARLFSLFKSYRMTFRKKLPSTMRSLVDIMNAKSELFEVVYAITAPPHKVLPKELPFFSKVNLLFHNRQIKLMNYKLKIFHIHEV